MQNTNGAALLSRIARGSLVTIRKPDGATFTGRASSAATEAPDFADGGRPLVSALIVAPGRFHYATAANVVAVA